MSIDLQNIKGGGLHYITETQSTQTKLFRAGLRHYSKREQRLQKGTRVDSTDYHDKIDYERGAIVHSRSSSNQYFNFHYMFGGFRKFFIQRWLIGHMYRRNLRVMWFPGFLWYSFCCYNMRKYDNAAHDFFYFSD